MGAIDTNYTFTATDVITSTKMNNILDQSAITLDAVFNSTLSVASGKLLVASGGVTSNELAANSVTTTAIVNANVTTIKIADANVTTLKIADSNVTTAKILDANVTTAKIADANVTAAKLSGAQTGTAPVYGVRAWVNFDGTVSADLGGTYARTSSTTVTINAANHGAIVGSRMFLDFTVSSGTAPFDGVYTVATVVSPNEFTVTSSVATSSTGTVLLKRKSIKASGNVSFVSASELSPIIPPTSLRAVDAGYFIVNFSIPMPSANYARSGFANYVSTSVQGFVGGNSTTLTTAEACDIISGITSNGGANNYSVTTAMFVG